MNKAIKSVIVLTFSILLCSVFVIGSSNVAYAASLPAKPVITSVSPSGSMAIQVKWKKVSKAKGYQVRYSTKSNMSNNKKAITTANTKKLSNLKSGTKYYIQIRAYKIVKGKKRYGNWSTKKSVITNYSITYILNGGTQAKGQKTFYSKTTNTFSLKEPTKQCHSFIGWYSKATNKKISAIKKGSTGNITVYAKWAEAHNYSTTVLLEPTCLKEGEAEYLCTTCGDKYKGTIPKLDHVFTNYVSNNDASCEKDGTKTASCELGCGTKDTIVDKNTAFGHKFTNYVSNNDASCEKDGTKTAICDNGCGMKDTIADENTAFGHTPANKVNENVVPYTATTNGHHDEVVYCQTCKKELSRETITDYSVQATLNNYTWEELSQISSKISSASTQDKALEIAKEYKLVGSNGILTGNETKTINLSNGSSAIVQIAGFYHDDKSDGNGKAGISFIFKDCIAKRPVGSGRNGWESTDLHTWVSEDLYQYLPEDLRSVIVEVDKKTNNVGWTTDINSVTVNAEKLWLPSCVEICGNWNNYEEWKLLSPNNKYFANADVEGADAVVNAEGTQYKLYADLGIDDACKITSKTWVEADPLQGIDEGYWKYEYEAVCHDAILKKFDGSTIAWALRSPGAMQEFKFTSFFQVRTNSGGAYGYYGNIGAYWADRETTVMSGICPGFCI